MSKTLRERRFPLRASHLAQHAKKKSRKKPLSCVYIHSNRSYGDFLDETGRQQKLELFLGRGIHISQEMLQTLSVVMFQAAIPKNNSSFSARMRNSLRTIGKKG